MYSRGNESVLTAFRDGEPVCLVVMGAGMASVRCLGMLSALAKAQMVNPTWAIGYSGGAINLAAFLSSPHALAETMKLYEYCATGACLMWRFGLFGPQLGLNNRKVISQLRFNERTLRSHQTELTIVATNDSTGESAYLDGRSNVPTKLAASTALRGMCSPERVDGELLSDGVTSFHLKKSVKKVGARKVLVLTNLASEMEDMEMPDAEMFLVAPDSSDEALTPSTSSARALYRGFNEAESFMTQCIANA